MTAHPVLRSLHDLGLYTWTGGALMGAVGLNGAAASLDDPRQRAKASTKGWSRWAPVSAAGLGAHLVGASGLLVTDWDRVRHQEGVAKSSAIKTVVTGAVVGLSAWSAVLNRKMAASLPVPVAGATEPSAATPPDVARTQSQLKLVQWLDPAVGLALVAITSWQSEQQRATEVAKGTVQRVLGIGPVPAALGAAALAGLAAAASSRRSKPASTGNDVELVEVGVVEVEVVDLDAGGVAPPLVLGDVPQDGRTV